MLFHAHPAFREFVRTVLVKGFAALKERMLFMINETAEQHYRTLLQSNPGYFSAGTVEIHCHLPGHFRYVAEPHPERSHKKISTRGGVYVN